MLRAGDIIASAEARVGISDPEPHLHPALHALVAALNGDNRLSLAGEAMVHRAMVARTVDRLEGLKWIRQHPEIEQEIIDAPLFFTGLPHSGAAYLHTLFERDRRFRMIRRWQALTPSPPPGADAASVKKRKSQMRTSVRPVEVEAPIQDEDGSEECQAFLEQSYGAAGFFNFYDVPSYCDWLMRRMDMRDVYRAHRRQLQLLQWRSSEKRRWALEYPNHLIAMDAIVDIFPDARFAMTHRDPVHILASIARMTVALRAAHYEPPVDPHRAGKQMLDFVRRHVDRLMAFSEGPQGYRVIHVDYYTLVADPMRQLRRIDAMLGLDPPEEITAGDGPANVEGQRGASAIALERFGIDPEMAEEIFADYRHRFGIVREEQALAALT